MKLNILIRSFLITVFSILLISACKDKSVNDLYKFPSSTSDTKDVQVQVNVIYKIGESPTPTVELASTHYLLNAYVFNGEESQVKIRLPNGQATNDLPVSLADLKVSFPAILEVPLTIQPGTNGFSFHFRLVDAETALAVQSDSNTIKNLEALRVSVQPGTAAAANTVDLSLATTFAYRATASIGLKDGSSSHDVTYQALLAPIKAQLTALEGSLDPAFSTDLTTYASALGAGLKYKLLTDLVFQKGVFDVLVSSGKPTDALVTSFSDLLKTISVEATTAIGTPTLSASKLFKPNSIDAALIPNPETLNSTIFAPISVSFTDADASSFIGGPIVITPPPSTAAVESYAVYYGSATIANGKLLKIGNVPASANPLSISINNGTTPPAGGSHFWVFPVVGGKELNTATSTSILNRGGITLAYPGGVARFRARKAGEVLPDVVGAGAGKVFSIIPSLPSGLTLNTATGAITGTLAGYRSSHSFTVTVQDNVASGQTTVKVDGYNATYWSADSGLETMATHNNNVYIAGHFKEVGPFVGSAIALDPTTGLQPENTVWPEVGGEIYVVTPDPSEPGAYYIAGDIEAVAGLSRAALNDGGSIVARIRADGSVDDNFHLETDEYVYALHVRGDYLYVGGEFSYINDQPRDYMGAVDRRTGAPLLSFDAQADSKVLAITSDGARLFAGGEGTFQSTSDYVAALDPLTGNIDGTYPLSSDGSVNALQVSNGILYVGGSFSNIGDSNAYTQREFLAGVNTTSGAIEAFDPVLNNGVYSLATDGTTLFVGGEFNTVGNSPVTRNNFAAFDIASGALTSLDPSPDDDVLALATAGGKVFLGGEFATVNGAAHKNFVGIDIATGTPSVTTYFHAPVLALALASDHLVVGGEFSLFNAVERKSVAVLDGVTGEATAFSIDVNNSYVSALAFSSDGATLYAGGQIRPNSGYMRGGVISVNAETGALNSGFDAQAGFLNAVKALLVYNGKVYVGGYFSSMGGQSVNTFAILNGTTGAYDSTIAVGGNQVESMTLSSDGSTMFVTGNFSSFAGQSRAKLAGYNLSTNTVTSLSASFDQPVVGTYVEGTTLYVYGWFNTVDSASHGGIAAFNLDNNTLTTFNADIQGSGSPQIYGFVIDGDAIYAGGSITSVAGTPRIGAASVNKTTGALLDWQILPGLRIDRVVKVGVDVVYSLNGRISTTRADAQ